MENEFIPKFMKGTQYDNSAKGVLRNGVTFRFIKRKIYFHYNYRGIEVKYNVVVTNTSGKNAKTVVEEVEGLEEAFTVLNIAMKRIKLEDLY
jgi:hypothetical protein